MNILVTALGGDISQSIINVLKRHYPASRIIGTDRLPQPFFSRFVDEFYVLPSAYESKYLESLDEFISSKGIDLLIPASELEIELLSKAIGFLKIPTVICNRKVVEVCSDKFSTINFLNGLGFPCPITSLYPEEYQGPLPIIVKSRFGSGSKSVRLCRTLDEARQYGALIKNPVYQECLLPSNYEVSCAVHRDFSGDTRVIQLRRVLSGGRTLWAQVIKNSEVDNLCEVVAEELSLVGSINIQLILTKDGPRVFEINPRISSTVAMRDTLGFNDLFWGIQEALGLKIPKSNIIEVGTLVGRMDEIIALKAGVIS